MESAQLRALVAAGLSQRQIGVRLGCSQATVGYWLASYGLKTQHESKRVSTPEAQAGRREGRTEIQSDCPRHGTSRYVLEGRGYYRCYRCRAERVSARRRKLKELLIAEMGGTCLLCSYDRSIRALEFHHVDPAIKQFGVSSSGTTRSFEQLRMEAAKCVLLCSNCHAEVEDGIAALPVNCLER